MAFGFGMGFRFGTRQGGGGGDPTALSEARLTALGFTTTRSGSAQRHDAPAGVANYETVGADAPLWQPVQVGGNWYRGLLVQPGSTPLNASSDDLSGWATTGSPSVVYTASGGLGGGGYTTITGTGGAWTVSKAITDASGVRRSLVRAYAPSSNAGSILVSQDNGSTTSAIPEDTAVARVILGPQTTANPTLRVSGGTTDTVIIYDFQHTKPGSGIQIFQDNAPQGGSPAAVGATTCSKTLGVAPTAVDISALIRFPDEVPTTSRAIFELNFNNATADVLFATITTSRRLTFRHRYNGGATTDHITSTDYATPGELYLMRLVFSAGTFTTYINGVQLNTTGSLTMPTFNTMRLGFSIGSSSAYGGDAAIVALQDSGGQVLGSANAGFNLSALADF